VAVRGTAGVPEWLLRLVASAHDQREQENQQLRRRIREEFMRSRQTYGSPRLTRVLAGAASRNRVARLMRQEHLFARQRSKFRVRTTDSRHDGPIAPNRVLNLAVRRRDQVWATDATCVLTGQGWLYVVALLDLYTRRDRLGGGVCA
jgi:putative transposase